MARIMGIPERIKPTSNGVLISLANHYTWGAQVGVYAIHEQPKMIVKSFSYI